MLKIIRLLLLLPLAMLASLIALLVCLRRPFDPTNSRRAARIYAHFILPLLGLRVAVQGWDNVPGEQPFVVVANHQSNLDLLVMGMALPPRTVSLGKKSLKWIPLFGQVYWLSGNVMIDRASGHRAKATMELTQQALQSGHKSIWVFVEGTRNGGNELLPFKKGAFVTAINCGAPVVRICAARYVKSFSWNRWRNGTIPVRILPPIATVGLGKADVDSLMAQCRETMSETLRTLEYA
jgi:1-acyl-sn-glycerol-3-phosphate acyltransferase